MKVLHTHVFGHKSFQGIKLTLWQESGNMGKSLQESSIGDMSQYLLQFFFFLMQLIMITFANIFSLLNSPTIHFVILPIF